MVRRWLPWGMLLAVAVAALVLGLHRPSHPSLDSRVQSLASQVRCPVCNGETVAQSQAAPSVEIRAQIRQDLQAGESPDRILAGLVDVYGPGILEKPQSSGLGLVVWVAPVVAAAAGAAVVIVVIRRWRPRRPPASGAAESSLAPPPSTATASVPAPSASLGRPEAGTATPGVAIGSPGSGQPPRRRRRRAQLAVAAAGTALVTGGAAWAIAASTGTRLPGQEITGANLGSSKTAADLQAAQDDIQNNDAVGAVRLYQEVLSSDPSQVQALCGEGWLLAQTGQPSLLQQGLKLLVSAERIDPAYGPAHLYRGLALLAEADYGDSVPELQWYLAHQPAPDLTGQVQKALAQAQAGLAGTSGS